MFLGQVLGKLDRFSGRRLGLGCGYERIRRAGAGGAMTSQARLRPTKTVRCMNAAFIGYGISQPITMTFPEQST